jgi:hypothetical protein
MGAGQARASRNEMQIVTRPKLLPPLALLAQGPGRHLQAASGPRTGTLSPNELRRLIADLIG